MHCYPSENILQLLTYCLSPQCLIFQYMENGSLDRKLKDTCNPLSWKERANIALGVARGLHHLHGNGVVHGDIKSSNIMLDKYLEPQIGDFGTVKLLYNAQDKETEEHENTHRTLQIVSGTRYYLPVWYIHGVHRNKVRKPVDVYSFGMVLLEIMSGRLPSDKDSNAWSLQDFVINQIAHVPEPPEEYVAKVDQNGMTFICQTTFGERKIIWPNLFYFLARLCTTKEFKEMPTIEQLHCEINGIYLQYPNNSEQVNVDKEQEQDSEQENVESMTEGELSAIWNLDNM